MQQTNNYNNMNLSTDNGAYRNWNMAMENTNANGIGQEQSNHRSDYSSHVSSDHYTHSNVPLSAHNISQQCANEHILQDNASMPNAIYDNATVDENCFDQHACNYLKTKSNSLLFDTWVPKKPKVFVRRIDGSRCPPKETVYRVKNGNYSDDKELPYNMDSRDVFVKQKLEEFEKMPCEYIGANTKRIISPQEGQSILRDSNNNKEFLNNFCVVDNNHHNYNNVPLCVQELNQTRVQNGSYNFPIKPLMQDEYYFRQIVSQAESQACILTPELIIRFLKQVLKCFSKTAVLVIEKIRAELNGNDYPVIFPENTLPNMDVACGVCEKTDFQRTTEANKKNNFLSFFEDPVKPSHFLTRLLEHFQPEDVDKTYMANQKMRNRKEVAACYQAEVFPKDENGKVLLPRFEE